MKSIFKNMIPYWKTVLIIFMLLIVQAYCDLSLPQYTSDIIDTGIQNQGIAHILPEKITKDEYQLAELFMSEEERQQWEDSYDCTDDIYTLRITEEKKLDELDELLLIPIVMNHRMANMQESEFKEMAAQSIPKEAQAELPKPVQDMTAEEISQMMQADIKSYEAEDEDGKSAVYVDARPIVQQMYASGQMTEEQVKQSRESLENMAESMGSRTLLSMGISYAVSCNKAAGLDAERIQMNYLWKQGGRMFLMALLMLAAAVGTGYLSSKAGAGIGRDLRKNIFSKVVGFSNAEMDRFSTASLITRSTNDIQQIQQLIAMLFRTLIYAPIMGVGGFFKVLTQSDSSMSWIIALAVGSILFLVSVLFAVAMPKFKSLQKLIDKLNQVSREILTGIQVIRAFNREENEEERFDKSNKDLTKANIFVNRAMSIMMPMMMFIMNSIMILIIWFGGKNVDSGVMQVGDMMAFIQYTMQIVISFLFISMISIMLPRAQVSANRINEVLETKESIKNPDNPKKFKENKKGLVEFKNVSFRYPDADTEILEDINFTAEPGKTTAIIGSTGSGKSTIVNLIPRFYDVTGGELFIDGVNVKEVSQKDLRDLIGFVPQKGVLFSGTIESNIKYSDENMSDENMKNAAGIAQATEFIEAKDDKYLSEISQGGNNVSGGQRQRLSIARAIAKDPEIFVFDDSFSALDLKTDAKLREALLSKTKNKTVIIVAQRISTILNADQIIVLEEGKVVGKGKHQELMNNCQTYKEIALSQLSEEELNEERGDK